MEYWKTFYTCNCNSEAVAIGHMEGDVEICLSFFTDNIQGQIYTWKDRLKFCWAVITTGRLYNDQVLLTPTKATKLGQDLIAIAKQIEKEEVDRLLGKQAIQEKINEDLNDL